jgi:hypothetical protein
MIPPRSISPTQHISGIAIVRKSLLVTIGLCVLTTSGCRAPSTCSDCCCQSSCGPYSPPPVIYYAQDCQQQAYQQPVYTTQQPVYAEQQPPANQPTPGCQNWEQFRACPLDEDGNPIRATGQAGPCQDGFEIFVCKDNPSSPVIYYNGRYYSPGGGGDLPKPTPIPRPKK